MSIASLTAEEIKALDKSRHHLGLLVDNIRSLQEGIIRAQLLPEWSSLQHTTRIVADSLITLANNAEKYSELFNTTVIFPLPTYPGRAQKDLLGQLVRKKLEPEAESWVEQGRTTDAAMGAKGDELENIWEWAGDWLKERVDKFVREEYGDQFTPEERELGEENIRTGLRPDPEDDSDDEDDEGGENEEKNENGAKNRGEERHQTEVPGRNINELLKFSSGSGLGINFSTGIR